MEDIITSNTNNIMTVAAAEKCPADVVLEILDEVKLLSSTKSASPITNPEQKNLAEELQEIQQSTSTETYTNAANNSTSEPTPGWRIIGSKKIWKNDWKEFDARQRIRRIQEKEAEKAQRRRRRQRKQQPVKSKINNKSNNNNSNNGTTSNNINCKQNLLTDRDMLAAAKIKFAGPPPSCDEPVPITSKFITFRQGETINPYRASIPLNAPTAPHITDNTSSAGTQGNADTQFELDPMRPPIVRLTQQSSAGDGRFLKARLRDPKIMHIVRLYLAYMKDQQPSVCMEGMTPTSIKMLLASEGLPTSPDHLQSIFVEVHQEYGLNPAEALADLTSYKSFLSGERTRHLQQIRDSVNKFYLPPNFRK